MAMLPHHRLRVTPDTHVCVSGGIVRQGAPGQIIEAWRHNRLDFALCEQILAEIQAVLARPYFSQRVGWTPKQIAAYVDDLREGSEMYPATMPVFIAADPDDKVVFACAIEAQADFLISGDKKHVLRVAEFQGVKTISPHDFVHSVLTRPKAA